MIYVYCRRIKTDGSNNGISLDFGGARNFCHGPFCILSVLKAGRAGQQIPGPAPRQNATPNGLQRSTGSAPYMSSALVLLVGGKILLGRT